MRRGTLFGIGVGPGDPDLITLKAVKILRTVDVVFAASSSKNNYSLAVEIVSPHLRKGIPIVRLNFPMTREKEELNAAWDANAEIVHRTLEKGLNAALLTLGDPMTYSTFGHLMRTMKRTYPGDPIEVVPGITSYQTAAASAGLVLAEGEESLCVVSGALGGERLERVIDHTENVVMLKVYRNYDEIMSTLDRCDLTSHSVLVSKCGLEGEEIVRNLQERPNTIPPYLSLLLIKKNGLK
jgi:precorrin-2/cobalt-factor-2 C20-methyltransferase